MRRTLVQAPPQLQTPGYLQSILEGEDREESSSSSSEESKSLSVVEEEKENEQEQGKNVEL